MAINMGYSQYPGLDLSRMQTPEQIQQGGSGVNLAKALGLQPSAPIPVEAGKMLSPEETAAIEGSRSQAGNYELLSKLAMLAGILTGNPALFLAGSPVGMGGIAARKRHEVTKGVEGAETRRAGKVKETNEGEDVISRRITALAHQLQAETGGKAEAAGPKQLEGYLINAGVFDKIKAGQKLSPGEQSLMDAWTEVAAKSGAQDPLKQWMMGQLGGGTAPDLASTLRSILNKEPATPAPAPKPKAGAAVTLPKEAMDAVVKQYGKNYSGTVTFGQQGTYRFKNGIPIGRE